MQFTTPELYNAFSKISPYNYDYCSMCFRSASERKLVKPRAFKKFAMDVFFDYTLAAKNRVCYMCEKKATDAYKFYEAVEFASTINRLLKDYWMMKKKMQNVKVGEKTQFMNLLKSKVVLYKGPVEKWEANLKIIRERTELMQTEVLVIDSLGTDTQASPVPDLVHDLVPENNSDIFIVPDEPAELLNRTSSETIIPGTRIDSVIIIDEEDDSSEPVPSAPKLVPIEKLLISNTDQNIIIDNPDPLSLMKVLPQTLQPPLPNNIQPQLPPNIQQQLPQNIQTQLSQTIQTKLPQHIQPKLPQNIQPKLAPNIQPKLPQNIQHQLPQNIQPQLVNTVLNNSNIGGYILHPVVIAPNGHISVPTLPAGFNVMMSENNIDHKSIQNNITNVELSSNSEKNARRSILLQQLLDKPNSLPIDVTVKASEHAKNMELLIQPLASEIRSQAEHNYTIHEADKEKKRAKTDDEGSVKRIKGETEIKVAVQKSDRIDWEDKIPMDVISFMDAIDPNANPMFAQKQSLPYEITEVRSLSQSGSSRSTNKSNNVIDLC